MPGKVIDIRGIPEAKKMLDQFQGRELENRTARATRAGAKVFRGELRKQVKSGVHPKSFRKTATRNHRTPIGTSVGPTSPLLNIFEEGAKRHTIAPGGRMGLTGRKMLLSGRAGEHYRSRGFAASMPVSHPGMGARPLIGPVFESTNAEAAEAAMDTLFLGHGSVSLEGGD